jgi:hypothetical protein
MASFSHLSVSFDKPIALFTVIIFFSRSEHFGKGFVFYDVNIMSAQEKVERGRFVSRTQKIILEFFSV